MVKRVGPTMWICEGCDLLQNVSTCILCGAEEEDFTPSEEEANVASLKAEVTRLRKVLSDLVEAHTNAATIRMTQDVCQDTDLQYAIDGYLKYKAAIEAAVEVLKETSHGK